MTTRRRVLPAIVGLAALLLSGTAACGTHHRTLGRRVIVLGFDGLDFSLTRDLMAQGRLPHFSKVAARGTFGALGTSTPPQSPVAWSSFITGLDPGGHGIFDFIHRDPKTMLPYLSTTRTVPPSHFVPLGRWQLPLTAGRVELLRQGEAFWERLEAHGIETTVVRMPADFPPSGRATRELSGMGTPDLLGTYGTFSFFTSEPFAFGGNSVSGGTVVPVDATSGVVRASLEGPDNPFLAKTEKTRAEFVCYIDAGRRFVKLVAGGEERLLTIGEWSDWVPLELKMAAFQKLHAEARFYLKRLDPYFELYASPLDLDPLNPALPISTPGSYAAELAEATGRFYSQGMPEETKGLKTGVLSRDEFLAQAKIAGDEVKAQFHHVLNGFRDGLLFYYFGNVDQVSHMMWRARDPGHPAYDAAKDAPYAHVIDDLYVGLDQIVGEAAATLGPSDLLVVMSDHGFTSWRRSFHLNSWLRDNGYLAVRNPYLREDPGNFGNVDWTKTRAYALGLNGLYINVKGREGSGIVAPADRAAVARELAAKLLTVVDPWTNQPAISKMFPREEAYQLRGTEDIAPDLIVGYAKGMRGSDESALGGLPREVIVDNTDQWNGDHCMDPDVVPGVLFTSRALSKKAPNLQSLASAIVAEFGVQDFPRHNQEK
jgi:predicted AlkP superfamily phosphohydrolase/phosphomutase